MSDASIPEGLKYTKDHEWAKIEGNEIVVGITKFAVEQLGDITMVTVDKKVGDAISGEDPFGSVESVKSVSDLLAPASGKITKINQEVQQKAELLNDDPYAAWLVRIEVSDATSLDALLDAAAYAEHVKNSA